MAAHLIRSIITLSVLLLMMSPVTYGEDRPVSLLDLDFKQQQLHRTDRDLSPREYEKLYGRNQRYVRRTLTSYSEHALNMIGLSDRTVNLVGAAFGVVINGAKLNLNESKTLAIEVNNLDSQEPKLYFGVNIKW